MKPSSGQTLCGSVTSGRGDFGKWIHKFQNAYLEHTGLRLYPGTLNLKLDRPFRMPKRARLMDLRPYGGNLTVYLLPCRVLGRCAFVLRTQANELGQGDHPHEVIEIATDIRLRNAHDLSDGARVEVWLDA